MAEGHRFKDQCDRAGWCCAHGFLAIHDAKARHTEDKSLRPVVLQRTFNYTPRHSHKILQLWADGKYQCEKKPICMLVKAGIRQEDLPTLSESHRRYLAIRGTTHLIFKCIVEQGDSVLDPYTIRRDPTHPGVRSAVISASLNDWLWLTFSMAELDTTIKLGDPLFVDNLFYGTVVHIDGPNVTLLFPGSMHGQRNRGVFNTNSWVVGSTYPSRQR